MKKRKSTDYIVVHCSDSPDEMDIGAAEIRQWHTDPKPRGNGWADIGYHYVIRRNGTVEAGRKPNARGAHVRGFNERSVGVCLVGRHVFTPDQLLTLKGILTALTADYPEAEIVGHRDLDPGKTCPNMDAKAFWAQIDTRATAQTKGNIMTFPEIAGLIRHALTTAGGALATHGVIEAGQVEVGVGAIMALVGIGWSIWQKRAD